mmetsp:Transcript_41390/g.132196  ORF Transcript_41390/g.132196 Transcript_41390/m.132196 type:complete len:262 (+) Transcript_41390:630-1415(+)
MRQRPHRTRACPPRPCLGQGRERGGRGGDTRAVRVHLRRGGGVASGYPFCAPFLTGLPHGQEGGRGCDDGRLWRAPRSGAAVHHAAEPDVDSGPPPGPPPRRGLLRGQHAWHPRRGPARARGDCGQGGPPRGAGPRGAGGAGRGGHGEACRRVRVRQRGPLHGVRWGAGMLYGGCSPNTMPGSIPRQLSRKRVAKRAIYLRVDMVDMGSLTRPPQGLWGHTPPPWSVRCTPTPPQIRTCTPRAYPPPRCSPPPRPSPPRPD